MSHLQSLVYLQNEAIQADHVSAHGYHIVDRGWKGSFIKCVDKIVAFSDHLPNPGGQVCLMEFLYFSKEKSTHC